MPRPRKDDRYSQKARMQARHVLIVEWEIQEFLNKENKGREIERFTTEITLFEFRKYIQGKRDELDPNLFEQD